MWELSKNIPLGRLSMRKYLRFVPALLVACFLYIFATTPPVLAADAQWKGDAISYDGHDYAGPTVAKKDNNPPLEEGSTYYIYTEPSTTPPKAYVIYFAPGNSPNDATSAQLISYDVNGTTYANPTAAQAISFTAPKSSDETSKETTSCAIEGIGYIICPVTKFLAWGMDVVYGMVASFLEVQPLATNGDQAMYRAWSFMRNFANIAFVIAFLLIIYSQITSFGMSNYGIKKMLPRIIVAAILVNTSYWICAIAIDFFNILGYSLQDLFIMVRNSLVGKEGNSWDVLSWQSMSGFILSGGSLAAAGGIGVFVGLTAIGGVTAVGLIFLFLPLLLSVLFVVLVTFLILAARQAIISVLVVVAPIAFVAYLLPNTEKWFEKWRSTFLTLLFVFPAFSMVFGGSQLAAATIIQNANSINIILLGMAVQVVPLAITPLLLRLGGGVLNRIAGIINNPTKGMFDRGKNWSRERAEQNQAAKMRRLSENPATLRRYSPSRMAYNQNQNKRKREGWKAANEAATDAQWKNTSAYSRIQQRNLEASQLSETGDSLAQATYNRGKLIPNSRIQQREVSARLAKIDVEVTDAEANVQWENLRAAESPHNITPAHLAVQALQARTRTQESLVAAQQLKSAQHEQQQNFAGALKANEALQARAGGISAHGADSALAAAIATERSAYGKSVEEARQIIKHFNLGSDERQAHALGQIITKLDSDGNTRTFRADSIFTREAAIEDQLKTGSEGQIIEIIKESGKRILADGTEVKGKTYNYRTTISDAIPANNIPGKSLVFGNKTINDVGQGNFFGDESLNNAAVFNIMEGKIRDDVLAVQGSATLEILYNTWQNRHSIPQYVNATPEKKAEFASSYQALRRSATKILTDPVNRNASEAARAVFEANKVDLPPDPTDS